MENFHKLVRWFYARTNREGGSEDSVVESSMNVMQLYWGQKLLEMESREGDYNQAKPSAMVAIYYFRGIQFNFHGGIQMLRESWADI